MTSLENVGGLAIYTVLSKLGPKEAASVSCLNQRFRLWAADELLWSQFCFQELRLSSPIDPQANPSPSFKAAYQAWREAFSMYPWALVIRVKTCYENLKEWLSINFPEVLPTLRKGASEGDIEYFQQSLNVKLPLPTRILYRFFDGQEELPEQDFNGCSPVNLLGIIGGYGFYNHRVNVFLLPLMRVMDFTEYFKTELTFMENSTYIVVAASSTHVEKLFFLNCTTGQLFVGAGNLDSDEETLRCVPETLISSGHSQEQDGDAVLLWVEEHVSRLQNGKVRVRQDGTVRSINLFPEQPPLCSISITNGVKVRASAVFVPEASNLRDEQEKYDFAYSIRMSLAPSGCVVNGVTFSSCQLYWRHWTIRGNDDSVIASVNGEAVIGRFPLLQAGDEEFVYESATTLPTSEGSIEGYFTFVPGSLMKPKGSPFEVEVARFPLKLPDYIF